MNESSFSAKAEATAKGELLAQRVENKQIIDIRTFFPHQIKESERWSWQKMRNEKWFVQLDCITGKLKKWKLE